jgi:Tfp pilus assembly protein PilF
MLRALTLQPGRTDIRYSLAFAYTEMTDYARAESELRKILLESPDSVDAHIALGVVLLRKKDCTRAVAAFQKALALQPANAEATQFLSQCHVDSR